MVAEDLETGELHHLKGKALINATGPFSDALRRIDDPAAPPLIAPSQGVHIVLDRSFSGLITVAGGKWATYRKMAEDTIDQALVLAELKAESCNTYNLPIHVSHPNAETWNTRVVWFGRH